MSAASKKWALPCILAAACGSGPAAREQTGLRSSVVSISVEANQIGRMTSSGSGPVRTYHQYDALGRVVVRQHAIEGKSYIYRSTYGYAQSGAAGCPGDPDNLCQNPQLGPMLMASAFPDGELVLYRYDLAGAQQSITAATCADGVAHTDGTCGQLAPADTIVGGVLRNQRGQP